MGQYNYDESGDFFNYFIFSVLAMVLVPTTYSTLFPGQRKKASQSTTVANHIHGPQNMKKVLENKDKSLISYRIIFLVLGWSLFAYTFRNAMNSQVEDTLWNPYTILDIEEGSDFNETKATAKRAYRKLALKWHPDKVTEDLAPIAEEKFKDINKAYLTLTDPERFQNWLDHGNPDGKSAFSLGIALPAWLVDKKNSVIVLGLYGLIIGITLPLWVSRWWNRSKNYTKDKIMHETMGLYYREVKEAMPVKAVIEVLMSAQEFQTIVSLDKNQEHALAELATKLKQAMSAKTGDSFDKSRKYSMLPWHYKASLLFYAHLLRVDVSDAGLRLEQARVVLVASHLVTGILQIAVSKNWLSAGCLAIELSQCIIQATYPNTGPLYQLPLIDNRETLKHFQTKKRNITTILELLSLSSEDKSDLLRSLTLEDLQVVDQVARQYPVLKVRKAMFTVLGEPAVIPNAIVTLIVKLKLLTPDEALEEKKTGSLLVLDNRPEPDDEEEPKKQWWTSKDKATCAYAPYFPEDKTPVWWVMLGDAKNNRLITMTKVAAKREQTARLQFQSPPSKGTWKFQVFVKSDSYVGIDAKLDVDLVVLGPEAAPLQEIEDDISEPEEDSLAGQMAAMKAQKGPKGEYDDSSDESDVEGAVAPPSPDNDEGPDSDFVE